MNDEATLQDLYERKRFWLMTAQDAKADEIAAIRELNEIQFKIDMMHVHQNTAQKG